MESQHITKKAVVEGTKLEAMVYQQRFKVVAQISEAFQRSPSGAAFTRMSKALQFVKILAIFPIMSPGIDRFVDRGQ